MSPSAPKPAASIASLPVFAPDGESGEPFLPAPERILSGRPLQRVWLRYEDASGQFFVGEWSSEVGSWRVQYTEHEYCEMLAGRIRLIPDAGPTREVAAGDRFVVPAGFQGIWEVLEPARKVFVVFEAQAAPGTAV